LAAAKIEKIADTQIVDSPGVRQVVHFLFHFNFLLFLSFFEMDVFQKMIKTTYDVV